MVYSSGNLLLGTIELLSEVDFRDNLFELGGRGRPPSGTSGRWRMLYRMEGLWT